MSDKPLRTQSSTPATPARLVEASTSHLREEYERWQGLFEAQPVLVQRFLEGQARALADALIQRQPQVRFTLPDQVVLDRTPQGPGETARVPQEFREQLAGGL